MESALIDRYAVIGNPIAHSRSPEIHAAFARQTKQLISYERLLAPPDGFEATVTSFRSNAGLGANVTVPFKQLAWQLATTCSTRAQLAQAANTLQFSAQGIFADNTDGDGLINDLRHNLNYALTGQRILLMGAGGAARGVIAALLEQHPMFLVIANRHITRALALQHQFSHLGIVHACNYAMLSKLSFDCVINATSASLHGDTPTLPKQLFAPGSLAYDLMYASQPTPFMRQAFANGATQTADGLGMLVEQAALSFYLWRGVKPDTQPILHQLRGTLHTPPC